MKQGLARVGLFVAALGFGSAGTLSADIFHFIDPAIHGEASHWTWRSSPPNGTMITVNYFIDQGGPLGTFSSTEIDRIHDSAATWSRPNSGALINLVEVFSGGPGIIRIVKDNIDGAGGEIGSTSLSFLGHGATTYPDGHPFHQITDALVRIDPQGVTFFSGTGAPGGGQYDFQSLMTHNFGHAIGLGNAIVPTQTPSVMEHALPTGVMRRVLSGLDMTAAMELYGPEPATWSLFGLGLGALGCARSRRAARGRARDPGSPSLRR